MKKMILSLSLTTLSLITVAPLSAMAETPSCVPYYQSRLAVVGARLKTLGIASPVASVAAGLGLGPVMALPGVVLVEEVVRLQIEAVHRNSVIQILTDAKKIVSPDWTSATELSPDSIKFYIKVFNKYPALGDEENAATAMKKISAKILAADQKHLFCNGSLKKKGHRKYDYKFKKNLARKSEFRNFVDQTIEESIFSKCQELGGSEYNECMKTPDYSM